MITKERLEELIEQDKVFYWVFNKEIRMLCNLSVPTYWKKNWELYGKDCFETKEDAEEYAEFGNITRTERLPYLPKWEDIEYENGFFIRKFHIKDNYNGLGKLMVIKDSVILVQCSSLGVLHEEYFNKPATRENYNEARRLCVKLFKGEE